MNDWWIFIFHVTYGWAILMEDGGLSFSTVGKFVLTGIVADRSRVGARLMAPFTTGTAIGTLIIHKLA